VEAEAEAGGETGTTCAELMRILNVLRRAYSFEKSSRWRQSGKGGVSCEL
jgi:hypothetical protein